MDLNRDLWEEWTTINANSAMYDVQGFKEGRRRLHDLELGEVGDVSGKSLLHLQCHFGLDTLSWAGLGAQVTGVDFSEKAINLARSLSEELHIPARFIQSNLYDLPSVLEEQFDIVFTSYGVTSWLPDIQRWGEIVGRYVKPGGFFYIAEGHPFMWTFENTDDKKSIKLRYPYFQGKEPLRFETKGNYADFDVDYVSVEYNWNHPMSSIVDALIEGGLKIDFLHEWPFVAWQAFACMQKHEDGWWYLPEGLNLIPLMFSLKASNPLNGNQPRE